MNTMSEAKEETKEEAQAVHGANNTIKRAERPLAEFEEKPKHAKTSLHWKPMPASSPQRNKGKAWSGPRRGSSS